VRFIGVERWKHIAGSSAAGPEARLLDNPDLASSRGE
jgi:hypothetical protein